MPQPLLRNETTRIAEWVHARQTDEGIEYVSAHPPEWAIPALAAQPCWPGVRHLEAIVETPCMRPDGTILTRPGHDPDTGLLFEPSEEYPPVPEMPTLEEAQAAVEVLLDLVTDFPFVGSEHIAVWLAGLLTPFARFAFQGPAPLFLFDASAAGSGKSLLTDVISFIATGRDMPRTPYADNNEELRKTISAVAFGGFRLCLIDNIDRPFGSASLDAALTAQVWRDRVLGKSQVVEVPLITTWYGSGNNVTLKGDMVRRVLLCRLEPDCERPEERTGFRHKNLLEHVRRERPRLVQAALTILRGYVAAGHPRLDLQPLGSFEGWSDLVRSAIAWAAERDPCGTRQVLRENDPGISQLQALLEGLAELPGAGQGITTADILFYCRSENSAFDKLRAVLMEWSRTSELPTARTIGNRFRALRRRVCGGRYLDAAPNRDGFQVWVVCRTS